MDLKKIDVEDFNANIFSILNQGWMLLSTGDFQAGKYNTMTVSWGFMGTFWFKPIVAVGVRPQRHSFELMEEYETFTLCAFSEEFKSALSFCGANSGRDTDKIGNCGLTPIECDKVAAPAFEQAELIIECRKVYADAFDGKHFAAKDIISECYKNRDFHKLFYGEVLRIRGVSGYSLKK